MRTPEIVQDRAIRRGKVRVIEQQARIIVNPGEGVSLPGADARK
ncbi:MAG: hypothetical protein WBP81_24455 [Solirubrobacteraceae bacterium]